MAARPLSSGKPGSCGDGLSGAEKVKAEENHVLFPDGEPKVQNEAGWGCRSLASVSVPGPPDVASESDKIYGFPAWSCPLHRALAALGGGWGA